MAGLVPPAGPKPLRRGEGPAIHVFATKKKDVDARHKAGHDESWLRPLHNLWLFLARQQRGIAAGGGGVDRDGLLGGKAGER